MDIPDCTTEHQWEFLMEPDDTGAMIICQACDKMQFVPIDDLEEFKKQFPDIKVRPAKEENKEQGLKEYLVIKNDTEGFEVWPRDRYQRFIATGRPYPLITVVTHFNGNEILTDGL